MKLDVTKVNGFLRKAAPGIDVQALSIKKTLSPEKLKGFKEAVNNFNAKELSSDKFQQFLASGKCIIKKPDIAAMLKNKLK